MVEPRRICNTSAPSYPHVTHTPHLICWSRLERQLGTLPKFQQFFLRAFEEAVTQGNHKIPGPWAGEAPSRRRTGLHSAANASVNTLVRALEQLPPLERVHIIFRLIFHTEEAPRTATLLRVQEMNLSTGVWSPLVP